MAAFIQDLLTEDMRQNLVASQDEPWTFDYVVLRDARDNKVLQILTRLFDPEKEGNIYYGRSVQRDLKGTYVLWADDTS